MYGSWPIALFLYMDMGEAGSPTLVCMGLGHLHTVYGSMPIALNMNKNLTVESSYGCLEKPYDFHVWMLGEATQQSVFGNCS